MWGGRANAVTLPSFVPPFCQTEIHTHAPAHTHTHAHIYKWVRKELVRVRGPDSRDKPVRSFLMGLKK